MGEMEERGDGRRETGDGRGGMSEERREQREEGEMILNSSRVMAGMAVLLLSMAFVLFVITAPVIAQPVNVWVNAPEYAAEGGTFVATIAVTNVTDFKRGQFDLSFDSSVLELIDVGDGSLDGETIPLVMEKLVDAGTVCVCFFYMSEEKASGSGHLAEVSFKVIGKGGDKSVLDLSNGLLVDRKAKEIPAEWIDAEVRIVKGEHEATPTANHVHNLNTSENFSSIQGAINDPDTRDGDVIEVEDGVYYENVDVSKSLTIRSRNGSANCIVQAAIPDDPVFEVTSGYVNISGFTVKGATDYEYAGIYLYYADYCNIAKNNCSNNYAGITLVSSNNNSISNNHCYSNLMDIYHVHSNNNSISKNNCSNSPCGIGFINSKNNRIANNTCSNNPWGISLMSSNNNKIVNNTCSNSLYGIIIWLSNSNTLAGNTLLETGIVIRGPSLSAYRHEIDEANTANGKPVYYWKDVEGGRIPDGAGQVILVNCTNVTIGNQNLNNASIGIQLAFSSFSSIKSNNCSNNFDGIRLEFSNNNHLVSNNCSNNGESDIYLYNSNNNSIANNNCSDSDSGIYLEWSNNNKLTGNTMIENGIVIMGYLLSYYTHEIDETNTVNGKPVYYQKDIEDVRVPDGAGQIILVNCTNLAIEDQNLNNASIGIQIAFSSSSTIKNNNCSNNLDGISLRESNNNCIANNNCLNNDDGIYFMYSNNNSISNNTCSSNRNGISLFDSNNNCISSNICSNNGYGSIFDDINDIYATVWFDETNNGYGIQICYSNNNSIYLNNFINNANNVDSSGLVNTWSSTKEIAYTYNENNHMNFLGNYWSDYAGSDSDGDGIGDTPYRIDVDRDRYPLMAPSENYFAPSKKIA